MKVYDCMHNERTISMVIHPSDPASRQGVRLTIWCYPSMSTHGADLNPAVRALRRKVLSERYGPAEGRRGKDRTETEKWMMAESFLGTLHQSHSFGGRRSLTETGVLSHGEDRSLTNFSPLSPLPSFPRTTGTIGTTVVLPRSSRGCGALLGCPIKAAI